MLMSIGWVLFSQHFKVWILQISWWIILKVGEQKCCFNSKWDEDVKLWQEIEREREREREACINVCATAVFHLDSGSRSKKIPVLLFFHCTCYKTHSHLPNATEHLWWKFPWQQKYIFPPYTQKVVHVWVDFWFGTVK